MAHLDMSGNIILKLFNAILATGFLGIQQAFYI